MAGGIASFASAAKRNAQPIDMAALSSRDHLHDRFGSLGQRAFVDARRVQMVGMGRVAGEDHAIELRLVLRLGNDRGRLAGGCTPRRFRRSCGRPGPIVGLSIAAGTAKREQQQ